MAVARPPLVTVLAAVMQTLVDADLATQLAEIIAELPAGDDPLVLKLRWLRNRYTTQEERPCIAIAFVSDAPGDAMQDGQYEAIGVMYRELALDIITDIDLPTEVEVDELGTIADVAGLEILSHFDRRAIQALKAGWIDEAGAPTALTPVARWCTELGMDNDEDLADFPGRLVTRVKVGYRVSSEDPMVLLHTGG